MKKKLFSLLALAFCMASSWALDQVNGVYQIGSAQDLVDFAALVNGGTTGANAVLTTNIDLDGTTWTPIGNSTNKYAGTFDGQGYAITNFDYTATSDYNGLFGYISNATVKNFSISGTLTSDGFTKNGVVGCATGTAKVTGIHSSMAINVSNFKAHTGGIVGGDNGATTDKIVVDGCEFSGSLTHSGTGDCQAGIMGYTGYSTIRNCIFSGTINGGNSKYGGILGYCKQPSFGGVQNCLSIGKIVADPSCTTAAAIIANFNGAATSNVKNNYYCLAEGSTTTIAIGNKASSCEAPHAVTASQLASGEVCYLLNGDQSNIAFHQTLSTDDVPTLDASHGIVYLAGRTHCDGTAYEGVTGYSNTANIQDDHDFVDGFCSYCDALDASFTMTPNTDGYYEISSANLLRQFAITVNGGEYTANAVLTADIDMTDKPWPNSIGDWQSSHMYKGKFDGQGHSITNLTINTVRDYHGLFGVVGQDAEIKNFYIDGAITVNNNSIGIVSYTRDDNVLISNIHSNMNFSGASGKRVGGIVGNANQASNVGTATIDRCVYSGTMTLTGTGNKGGIVGYILNNGYVKTTISNCIFDGTITNDGDAETGGIVGYAGANLTKTVIKNCLSIGTVNATVSGQVFGVVKSTKCSIVNSYYQGSAVNGTALDNSSVTPTINEATEVTDAQLASGYVTAKLGYAFHQNLGSDDRPTLDKTKGYVTEIKDAGWSTQYITDSDVTIPTGMEVFAGVLNGSYITLEPITDKIQAEEPVILSGAAGFYNFMPTTGATKADENDLTGSDGTVSGGEGIYALSKQNDVVGFYPVASSITIPEGRAYLDTNTNPVKGFFSFEEDDATAIKTIDNEQSTDNVIYNVAGQRLQKIQNGRSTAVKGIYIVNGKKVLF